MLCSHRGVYDENHTKTLFSPQQTQQVVRLIHSIFIKQAPFYFTYFS